MRLSCFITRWMFPALLPVLLLAQIASAQVPAAPGTAKAPVSPVIPGLSVPSQAAAPAVHEQSNDDPFGRSTPRGTVLGFIKAASSDDYDTAVQYLDTRQHGQLARKLAQQLKEVLDRDASIDLARLSRKPEGSQANPEKLNEEHVGSTSAATGNLPIRLTRVKLGDEPPVWLFSAATLAQIPDAHDNLTDLSPTEQKLPGWLQARFLTVPIWRWLVLIAAIPLVLFIASWLNKLFHPIFMKFARRVAGDKVAEHVQSIHPPLRLLLIGIVLFIFGTYLPSVLSRAIWRNVGLVVIVIGVTWFFTRIIGGFTQLYVARLKRLQSTDKIALAGLIGRLSQIGAVIIGALVLLDMRGINLTAVLTGLGIGGLAVAFAAQKTLENLFGGIMIISDRPIRIGDQCKIGLVEGNVLDIGLRSTRIRTPERTIVTIPNGQLSIMNVENFTLRDKYRFYHVLTLRYDTTAAQMQAVLGGIRRLFEDDPGVETPTARVNFIAIRSFSDDIEISAYIFAENPVRFYEAQEALLLKILGVVESAGAEFSLPTQVTKIVGAVPATASAQPSSPPAAAAGSPEARG
jgi:MscS family membrane protein